MNMIELRHRIEQIVGAPLTENSLSWDKWQELGGTKEQRIGLAIINDGVQYWPWSYSTDHVYVWEMEHFNIKESESRLIELLLQAAANQIQLSVLEQDNEEVTVSALGAWLRAQLRGESLQEEIPDHLRLKGRLLSKSIPFLLSSEHRIRPNIHNEKLSRLLESYFGVDVLLIPIEAREWLILVGEAQLEDLRQVSEEGREAERTMLGELGQGLLELITSEWVGNFSLSVAQPIVPEKSLVQATKMLQETVTLGKIFRVSEKIYMAWDFHLEQLVYSIPDKQRKQFLDSTEFEVSIFNDAETLTTLETFFQLDCNVSETAKRLYIHRNTLLYRMDKIKQETGLDVRSFKDAVLVKLMLLLYNVTKRK